MAAMNGTSTSCNIAAALHALNHNILMQNVCDNPYLNDLWGVPWMATAFHESPCYA